MHYRAWHYLLSAHWLNLAGSTAQLGMLGNSWIKPSTLEPTCQPEVITNSSATIAFTRRIWYHSSHSGIARETIKHSPNFWRVFPSFCFSYIYIYTLIFQIGNLKFRMFFHHISSKILWKLIELFRKFTNYSVK